MQMLKELAKKTKAALDEVSREAQSKGKKEIKEHLDDIFKAHPDIVGIRWTQYTPYFNDGNECEFSVHEVETKTNTSPDGKCTSCVKPMPAEAKYCPSCGEKRDDSDEGDWDYGISSKHKGAKAIESFSSLICSTDMELIMKTVFGDHVRVTVTPEDVVVEDYEHD